MPPGVIHEKYWRRYGTPVLLTCGVSSLILASNLPLYLALGYGLGYYLDPDLDQLSMTVAEGRLLRHFKDLGAFIVGYFLWYAYRFKHRGISHLPVLGTLTRWLWIAVIPSIVAWWYRDWASIKMFLTPEFLMIFLGNSLADLIHSSLDYGWMKYEKEK